MGLARNEILDLPIDVGDSYLENYDEILNPNRPRKQVVRRRPKKKKKK